MKTRSIVTMTMLFLSLCLVLTYGSTSSTLNRPDQFSKLTILGGGPATADSVAPCDRSIDPERTTTTFVGIENGHFILNGRFRFMGANNVYLHYEPKPMVDDVIEDAAKMNLTVLRCWGFLDGQPRPDGTVLQPEPGVYNESGFGKLDYAIEKAKEEGIRLVIVLINNWADFGGMPQYIEWVKSETGNLTLLHDDFYTNERCQQIYKDYVMYVLNRNNTYTGLKYKDDPTIMAWELANEPRCDSDKSGNTLVDWAQEMSDYIKSIDPNHLLAVGDGGFLNRPNVTAYRYDGSNGVDWERLIKLPNIDYGTFHLYPEYWGKNWSDTLQAGLEWIKVHCDLAKEANIPVVLEEYGVSARSGKNRNMIYEYWNEALYENDADGSMFWILTGIDTVQARADNGTGLYPDVSGFRVVEGSDTAQLISEYAQLMAGELNETDLPPRIYLINPYEEEEIAGNYQVNTTVFPRGKEVQEVTFNSSLSNQTVTLNFTFIGISMKYTYAGIWNTSEEPNNQKVEGIARVTFTDGYSASTSVNVTIANGPVQYVIREQFTFDNDLEGFSNASTYHAEYGSPPIQHSDFNGGSLQANIKWFGDKAWSEITLAKYVPDLSDFTKIIYEMYIPRSQLNDTEGTFRPFFALDWGKINVGSSDVPVSNAQVVEIDGAEYYRVIVGSEYEKRSGKTELELGLVGAFLNYEGPVYIDNVTLIKKVAASANCVILNNHSGYKASDGKYYLTGEVQNQGTTAVSKPLIFVRFLDDDGIQITTQTTPSLLSVLLAGRKAPFELSVDSARVHSYEFYNLTFSEASDLELGLEISSCNWTKAPGNITVTGVVKNMGTYLAHDLRVVCTFYDVSGKVVGAQNVILADTPLNPQQQRPFTIIELTDLGRESVYATYQLTAESNEYGIISEMPFSICVYALFVVSGTAVLLRVLQKKKE